MFAIYNCLLGVMERKKYIYLLLIAILLFGVGIFLAGRWERSLKNEQSRADSLQVDNYFKLANHHLYELSPSKRNVLIAKNYVNRALHLSQRSGYIFGSGESYLMLSNIYKELDRDSVAMSYTWKAISLFRQHQLTEKLGDGYAQLGWFYDAYNAGVYKRILFHESAQTQYGLSGKKIKQANMLLDVADCYTLQKDWLRAERILQNALTVFKSAKHKDVQGVYDLLNQTNIFLLKFDVALTYGKKALEVANQVQDSFLNTS